MQLSMGLIMWPNDGDNMHIVNAWCPNDSANTHKWHAMCPNDGDNTHDVCSRKSELTTFPLYIYWIVIYIRLGGLRILVTS